MSSFISLVLFSAIVLASCNSAPTGSSESAESVARYNNGLPEFATVEDAIAFAVEEENLQRFRGVVAGSEFYEFSLPSGATTSNWAVDGYFRALFRPFGTEAFDDLAPLLDHEHEFVQVGAYAVLNSYMHAHGLGRHQRQTKRERLHTMKTLQELLAQGAPTTRK